MRKNTVKHSFIIHPRSQLPSLLQKFRFPAGDFPAKPLIAKTQMGMSPTTSLTTFSRAEFSNRKLPGLGVKYPCKQRCCAPYAVRVFTCLAKLRPKFLEGACSRDCW